MDVNDTNQPKPDAIELTEFASVLVANRGEIAMRVMRTARARGLLCIAVYTQADADAPHVAFADQAVCIGAGPVSDSYLSTDRILKAARETGADAVHPGYGFLSESADFAQACANAGLVFIGPSPDAIALMGNKARAKQHMIDAGVPCVPGYAGAEQTDARFSDEAARIGYPVMIKAAAGGGGRGMRLVDDPGGFLDALHLAQAEAKSAFGSDEIILEKAIVRPRHIELQIFADRHGQVVHLGERDCSVQRRHQKVVEESPSPVMTPWLRDRMGAAAINAARSIGYEGAGTVEFLLDDTGAFYFLEMNTRLQVEHPVTELVTGRDLVALQLAVARGEHLGFDQSDVIVSGHAIEVRLYAEDPAHDFLPQTGDIALWQPGTGPDIRVDDAIRSGLTLSPYYDPMLAKIIAYGTTRDEARTRLIAALQDSVLFGVVSNRDFLIDILCRPSFAAGQATTAFIDEEFGGLIDASLTKADLALAAGLIHRALQAQAADAATGIADELLSWSSGGVLKSRMRLGTGDATHDLALHQTHDGTLAVHLDTQCFQVTGQRRDLRVDGRRIDIRASLFDGVRLHVATGRKTFSVSFLRPQGRAETTGQAGSIAAPMHGNVLEVFVAARDMVQPGTRLAVVEAMKMQHELISEVTGVVQAVTCSAGDQVRAGQILIEIDIAD